MEERLLAVARRFWPELEKMGERERAGGVLDVVGFLYSAPLALVGIAWLIAVTDLALIRTEWPTLLLLSILLFLFRRFSFFVFVEIKPGDFVDLAGSLDSVIMWSAALLFGPTALWLAFLWGLIDFIRNWRRSGSTRLRWNLARNLAIEVSGSILTSLAALALYSRWGGGFPLPGLTLEAVLPALYVTLIQILLSWLVWMPILLYFGSSKTLALTETRSALGIFIGFIAGALALPVLIDPFAILAAGLHTQHGLWVYLFFIAGSLLANLLTHQLSQAVGRSQQRSRELEKLEQLGRAIINAPPDASTLSDVLKEHVSNMFPHSLIEIRIFPAQTLLHHPESLPAAADSVWEWLHATSEARYFSPGEALPWDEQPTSDAIVAAPIVEVESAEPIGGIYLARRRNPDTVARLLPAVQSLAAQVASALHSAEVYEQTLAHQKVEQELVLAGKIQASFLPTDLPDINFPGWQMVLTLESAREMSGDFYDLIPLSDDRLGILVADVADKGTAAALYMALSRTLIRTYALEYDTQPELALNAANRRILMDTRANLFVTVFYGILDSATGTLTYCNAGHNPPYLFSAQNGGASQALSKTGMALGVIEDVIWEQRTVQIDPGDVLVLYTDGITEAQNGQEALFGEERLLEVTRTNLGRPALDVLNAVLAEVRGFVGDAPQSDDITLMIVARSSTGRQAEFD
jgi:serine phosphatase RsbU (regulator of sigma subunit)